MWGIWGSYYNIPQAIFYLLKGDYSPNRMSGTRVEVSQEGSWRKGKEHGLGKLQLPDRVYWGYRYINRYIGLYVYIDLYIYIYIHIYMCTHTHAHIFIQATVSFRVTQGPLTMDVGVPLAIYRSPLHSHS